MSIEVLVDKLETGYVLLSADEFKDTLAGPFDTLTAARDAAVSLGLHIQNSQHTKDNLDPRMSVKPDLRMLKYMPLDTLFRVDNMWYRKKKNDGKVCTVAVVGENREIDLPGKTVATEISVLSLK